MQFQKWGKDLSADLLDSNQLVDHANAVDIIDLDFSQPFNKAFRVIPIKKRAKCDCAKLSWLGNMLDWTVAPGLKHYQIGRWQKDRRLANPLKQGSSGEVYSLGRGRQSAREDWRTFLLYIVAINCCFPKFHWIVFIVHLCSYGGLDFKGVCRSLY